MYPDTLPITVFLVEDSLAIRQRLEMLLGAIPGVSLLGHAQESDEAVARIIELKPDAVVLDLNLAGSSGIDVLRSLSKKAPEVEVFVLTNFANAQYRRACIGLGAKGFFDKSTEFGKVRETIAARALRKTYHI